MNRLINIGIFSTLFLNSIILFKEPFEFYISYIPILLLLPFFVAKFRFPKKMLYLFLPLLGFGLINIFFGNNTMGEFLKIYVNVFVSALFFYYVFLYYDKDLDYIFGTYMKVAIWISVLGLVQLASFWVGFKQGYDFRFLGFNKWGWIPGGLGIRVNAIFSEPSYYGASMSPAFFVAVINLLFRRHNYISFWQSVLIAVVYLLTFSTVAYLGVFVVMLLILINFGLVRYIALAIPLAIVIFNIMYNNADEFRVRVDGLKALYVDELLEKEGLKKGESNMLKVQKLLKKVHGSSFVQYNNYKVATVNFLEHPLFGTGLGSHKTAFERYNVLYQLGGIYKFNTADANSMLLRTLSETGLFGLLFLFLYIKRYFIKIPEDIDENNYWLMSNAVLVLIILQLARQGNYTYNGFIFYLWLYYFAYEKRWGLGEDEEESTEDASLSSSPDEPMKGLPSITV